MRQARSRIMHMQRFLFNPPINFYEEKNWLLTVTSFEEINSDFNVTDENNQFSVITLGYYSSRRSEDTTNRLQNLIELRRQNEIELNVNEVEKRGLIL